MIRPVSFWCRVCERELVLAPGAERPDLCGGCRQVPHWTRTPPYRLNANDRRFLHSIHVDPV